MKKLTITILATIALAIIIPTAAFAEYKHGDMIQKINAYCDMSPEEQAEAIAKYSKHSHYYKSEDKISKINEYCSLDEEGRQAMIAEYKDKWSNYKSYNADLTPEEREVKMTQFKEMKEAFSAISEDDRQTLMTHFKDLKTQYAELSEEEHSAKHTEMKQQMEAFMGLSLDEKISYLKYKAMSLRN